ncbi:hypothetical protein D3C77_625670 [compost metagenome]
MDPEAGHHFVKNKQAAVLRRNAAQAFQEARLRRDDTHIARYRLNNNAGDFLAKTFKSKLHRFKIVVRNRNRVCRNAFGNARAVWKPQRSHTGAGFNKQAVGVAMI